MDNPHTPESRYRRFVGPLRQGAKVLEIGALNKPTISDPSVTVRYADFTNTEELQRRYASSKYHNVEDFVKVDYVISGGDYVSSIQSIDPSINFDLILGSHVAEHIPDIVGWFHQMADLLSPGGILSLILPDKRFTFDLLKQTTTAAEWLSWYEEKLKRPSAKQIYDHVRWHAQLDDLWLWSVPDSGKNIATTHTDDEAWSIAQRSTLSNQYFDAHCSILTPKAFSINVKRLQEIGLMPFVVDKIEDTHEGSIEFFVRLRKPIDKDEENDLIIDKSLNDFSPYKIKPNLDGSYFVSKIQSS